jgi:hypothetical protein
MSPGSERAQQNAALVRESFEAFNAPARRHPYAAQPPRLARPTTRPNKKTQADLAHAHRLLINGIQDGKGQLCGFMRRGCIHRRVAEAVAALE